MAARTVDVLGVQLEISGSAGTAKKLQQELAPAIDKFSTDFSKSIARVAKSMGDDLTEVTTKFTKGFASPDQIKRMEQAFYKGTEPIWQAMEKARKAEEKLAAAKTKDEKNLYMLELKNLKDYVQKYQFALKDQYKREVAKDEAVFERKKKLAEDYNDFFSKSFSDQSEEFLDAFGQGLRHAVEFNLAAAAKGGGGIFSRVGAGLQTAGTSRRLAAEATGGGGGTGKMMEMLGGAIGKIGSVLSMIGGAVAGLGALVKVLLDADAQTKEFNRDIIKASGAMDVMGTSGASLSDSLKEVRDAALDATSPLRAGVKGVMQLGLTTKEYLEVFNKFQEVGVTATQMRGDLAKTSDGLTGYTKFVSRAATASRMFGEDLGTMAGHMGEYMKDLGLTLDEVSSSFAGIAEQAKESGFGTKRFFSMVLQATSGITMYNVRLAGTARLLTQLGRALGGRAGGEMLKSLTQSITGESYQDRYKRILTTGQGVVRPILAREAEAQAAGLRPALAGKAIPTAGMTAGAADVASKLATASDKDMVAMLAKISAEDRRSLVSSLSRVDENLSRRLEGLIDVSKGTTGKIGDQAKALENVGPGGKLLLELRRMQQVIGKPLDKMSGIDKMAYQQMTGASSEQIAMLERIQRLALGDFENAKRMAEIAKDDPSRLEELNESLKKTGMQINKDFQVVSDKSGRVIKDGDDAILNFDEESHKEDLKQLTEQERLSKEVAVNTYDLSNLMQGAMMDVLNRIADFTQKIYEFLGLKESGEKVKAGYDVLEKESEARTKEIDKQMKDLVDVGKRLKEASGTTSDPAKKAEIQKALDENKKQVDTLREKREEEKLASKDLLEFTKNLPKDQVKLLNAMVDQAGMGAGEALSLIKSGEIKDPSGTLTRLTSVGTGDTNNTKVQTDEVKKLRALADKTKKTEDKTKENTDAIKKSGEEQLRLLQEEARARELSSIKEALISTGKFSEEHFGAGFRGGIGSEEGAKELVQKLARDYPALFAEAKGKVPSELLKKYGVQDALITSDGRIVQGSKGDAVAFLNEEALRRGGKVGGSANVVFHIHATEGREDVVTDKVVAGLHQVYSVLTGDAATVGV